MRDSNRRCERWLDLAGELLERPAEALPVQRIAVTLMETFQGNQSGYVTRAPCQGVRSLLWPPPSPALLADTLDWQQDHVRQAEHPLVHWFTVSGDLRAQSVGHLPVGLVGDHRQASWYELSRQHGIEHQMSMPVYWHNGADAVFVISRPEEDFSDDDLELAHRVQRLVIGLDRRAKALMMSGWATDDGNAGSGAALSGRELTVLALLPTGLTTAAIARRLSISPRTVDKHLENIYRKLHTRDRLSTVLRAQQLQILRSVDPGR